MRWSASLPGTGPASPPGWPPRCAPAGLCHGRVAQGPLPPPADPRQVPGEVIEDGSYHYYPARPQAREWLNAAGFAVTGQADNDDYWHLLMTRPEQ